MQLFIWYVGAICAGCLFGFLFFLIFKMVVRPGITRNYFKALGSGIYGLLKGEVSEFWHNYLTLIRQSLFYAGTQCLGVALALTPTILLMVFLNGPIQASWNRGASLSVIPDEAGSIVYPPNEGHGAGKDARNLAPPKFSNDEQAIALVLKNGRFITIEDPLANYSICRAESIYCTLMQTLGFKVISVPAEDLDGRDVMVVRALRGDSNPFWPYLNNLEFLFLLSLSATTVVSMIRWRDKDGNKDGSANFDMSLLDYMITWIATHNIVLMQKIGDLESKIVSRKLSKVKVEKPIFISGLARSGTTILLEILAKADGLCTHRYKDFPFIMTPVLWNGFTRLFSSKQELIERPHKDRIKITKESPDAFEEPIWQFFSPHLHDPASLHIVHSKNGNPDFEKFYVAHIKKIMIVRKGTRYLSKGNYNLTRVDYIKSIFPDVRFVIPVRHPFSHIESLVRQHKLFLEYAKENQQVAEYLKAVGHYEFGPQRMPTILSKEGGSRIMAAWDNDSDSLGYAIQWAEIYRYTIDLFKIENIAENICVVRYEDLCHSPQSEIDRILRFLGLTGHIDTESAVAKISPLFRPLGLSEEEIEQCWEEVEPVARRYGYSKDTDKTEDFSQSSFI